MSNSPLPFSYEPPPPPPAKKNGCAGVLLVLLVIVVGGFAACYYYRDQMLAYFRTTPTPSVIVSGNGVAVQEATNQLPENFPEDIPVYRGLTSLGTTYNVEKGSGEALLYGNGRTGKVLAFYQEQMPQNGWRLTKDLLDSTKTRGDLFFEKADRKATVMINVIDNDPSGNGMSVKITYGKK